jgi:hypothetical protein
MKTRTILALAALLALLIGTVWAEPYYVAVSATTASQTSTFPKAGASVLICNDGTGIAYVRLFNDTETAAAATSSSSSVPVGACITYTKPPTEPAYWRALSTISASTSTVRVYVD